MFWVKEKRTHFIYKVYGWREDDSCKHLEFRVWADGEWFWLSDRRCEPTEPALYTMNLVEDQYENKFTRYFIGDD